MPPISGPSRAARVGQWVLTVLSLALLGTALAVVAPGLGAGAQTAAPEPFGCDDTLYLVTGGHTPPSMQLNRLNRTTGALTPVSDPDLQANAIAFNPADGFIYGLDRNSHELVRIDATGAETALGVPSGLPAGVEITFAGTFLPNGRYLVALDYHQTPPVNVGAFTDSRFAEIDVTTNTVVRVFGPGHANASIQDLAVDPGTGRIYAHQHGAVTGTGRIVEVNHSTGALSAVTSADPPRAAGSVFFDEEGQLWLYGASDSTPNQQDTLYRAPRPNVAPTAVATGPNVTNSDGASCPYTTLLDKTVSPERVAPGATVTYTFVLRNQAPAPVTADLEDVLANGRTYLPGTYTGPGTPTISEAGTRLDVDEIPVPAATWTPGSGVVRPGEATVTIQVRVAATTAAPATLLNQAHLRDISNAPDRPRVPSNWPGDDPSPDDPDPTPLEVVTPGLTIDKTVETRAGSGVFAEAAFSLPSTPVTWRIRVANPGPLDLTGVTVTDPRAPACARTIGAMAAGTATTYDCTVTAGYAATETNRASVVGTPPHGAEPVRDDDDATVAVGSPAVAIDTRVETAAGTGEWVDDATYQRGQPATWRIVVTNTGSLDLTDVAVTAPELPACDLVVGDLAVGASRTYTCTAPGGHTVDVENLAAVVGTPALDGQPLGLPVVRDDDLARIDVIAPALELRKQVRAAGAGTNFIEADARDGLTGLTRAGLPVEFRIVVTNRGDVALTDVTVTDALVPACSQVIGDLAAGATVSATCTAPGGFDADAVNQAAAVGTPPLGPDVTATDTAAVTLASPAITVVKQVARTEGSGLWVDDARRLAGTPVTYRITVGNTGDTTLTGVIVADPQVPACARTVGTLAAGASTTYTCTVASGLTESVVNEAVATGRPPVGEDVTADDTAAVEVFRPELTVDKKVELLPGSGQFIDADHRDDRHGLFGPDPVRFRITVTNTGDVDLADVVVDDDLGAECDREVGDLAVGRSATYDCEMVILDDVVNHAEATGTPVEPDLDPVLATDSAQVQDMPEIDLAVDKRLSGELVAGEDAVWRLTVTNTSSSPAYREIVVTDDLPEGLTFVDGRGDVDCEEADGTVTCVLDAGLDGGEAVAFELVTAVAEGLTGEVHNEAVVASLVQDDVDPSNDLDDAAAVLAEDPDDPGDDPGDPPPAVDGGDGGSLPRTGAAIGLTTLLGAALLALGLTLRAAARRAGT